MLIQKSYQFVAAPKPYQQIMLFEWGSALRFVWNWGLKQRIDVYTASEGRVSISYIDQQNQLPALKLQFKFLKSAPSSCLQNVLRDLDKAFAAFFAGRSGFPKKKKARRGDSCGMRFPDSLAFRLVDKCGIIIPKLGRIKLRAIRPIEGKMKNVLLSRRGEKWLISIQVEQEISSPIRRTDSPIGLDAGVSNSLSDNLGNFYKLPVASEKEAKWIKKLQRNAARKKVGSKRREKANKRALKARRKISNRVNDARHKLTTKLVKAHGIIAVEDLTITKMVKSAAGTIESPGVGVAKKANLNRKILEQSHYETVRQLEYKLAWSGGTLVKVNPAYTSQQCSACGHTHEENRATQAVFACKKCGHEEHADTNAAKNILGRGLNLIAGGQPVKVERPKARGVVSRRTVKREPAGGAA